MQIADLLRAGVHVDDLYTEKVSSSSKRPRLKAAFARLRPGDTLVVWRIDRLGRNTVELLTRVKWLQDEGMTLEVLHGVGKDMTSAGGKFLVAVLAAAAEFERDMIAERTRAGMQRRKERGEQVGREREIDVEQVENLLRQGLSDNQIAKVIGKTRQAFYRYFDAPERARLRKLGPKGKRK